MPTAAIATFGCRLNQADTALLADELRQGGFTIVPWGSPADLQIINSCSVTGTASQKSRQAVHQARKISPQSFIIIAGCDASAEAALWAADCDVDLVLPNPKPAALLPLLPAELRHSAAVQSKLVPAVPLREDFRHPGTGYFFDRTRANLKIQEGCDFYCSYCLVPSTRGRAYSRNLDDILREAEALLSRGHRELVLTGVNIATYRNSGLDLAGLLLRLLDVDPSFRIRLGSTEPGPVLERVVEVMAEQPRLCRFLHLPVQYGESSILQRMRRHYSAAEYAQSVIRAWEKVPLLCLGTDVIVGFPGETEQTFAECLQFLTELPFGLMHVFPYSPRAGTPAATFPDQVPAGLAERRAARLLRLAEEKCQQFADRQIGQRLPVLLEKDSPHAEGWTDNYLKVRLPQHPGLRANTLITAEIVRRLNHRAVLGTAPQPCHFTPAAPPETPDGNH
ncbi:MAG: tRNA (N(6)-L-threonylcarbamoyladenosine(37)-C(2))-methylthiotransferase MtaB [Oligosphaeraceae bacterium]|nr:tRNA (N(6)-L-threonylcarbamoyladenosine(37)-C(2))-methylthiotransferase MtaB [Oligosphaeraceae bacterium]